MADKDGDLDIGQGSCRDVAIDAGKAECGEDVIDWPQVMSRIGDEELIGEVMPVCVADNKERLEALAAAVGSADASEVKMCAHAIKGSAANVGAVRLSDAALGLERIASANDLSKAGKLLKEIKNEFERFEAFVSKGDWIETVKRQRDAEVKK